MAEAQTPGITQQFADFVIELADQDLPPEIIECAKNGILDFLGVALLGSQDESARMILQSSGNSGGAATVLGTDTQTTPTQAAMVNSYAAHALDYDDTQHDCGTHISAPVLGAALASAEACRGSGKDLIAAYVAGFEVGCRLGRVARFGDYLQTRGVHGTGFLGHFGAVAAAAKPMNLKALQMRRAFGIVAAQAAGLLRSFGTMCKPLHAANAAHNAVRSALLARQGFTGPDDIFEGKNNIFEVFGGRTDPVHLVQGLGRQFEISRNTIKAYACAGGRNPVIEAMVLLAEQHVLQPHDVSAIQVWLWPHLMSTPNYPQPRTGLESKFSTEYAAAVGLTDHAGGINQFTDERVADSWLAALCRRVTVTADEQLEQYQVRVLIRTCDGREFSHFIPAQKGDPRNPLSHDELVAKFRANALTALPEGQVQRLAAMVRDLETVTDIAELTRLCRPGQMAS